MTVVDAQEFVKIIRKENYEPQAAEDKKFLRAIEKNDGSYFYNGRLSALEEHWLKSIYARATDIKRKR